MASARLFPNQSLRYEARFLGSGLSTLRGGLTCAFSLLHLTLSDLNDISPYTLQYPTLEPSALVMLHRSSLCSFALAVQRTDSLPHFHCSLHTLCFLFPVSGRRVVCAPNALQHQYVLLRSI